MVHDNETVVGIVFLDNDGRLTIVHGFTNDSQVLEYARAGDYWALAHRLESNNATPEMLRLAADVLRGDFKRKKQRPKSVVAHHDRLLIAASVGLLIHTGRSRKDALFSAGQAFKCKSSKIEAAIAKQPPLSMTICDVLEHKRTEGRGTISMVIRYALLNALQRKAEIHQLPRETIDLNGVTFH